VTDPWIYSPPNPYPVASRRTAMPGPTPVPTLRTRVIEPARQAQSRSPFPMVSFTVALIGAAICAYHGYKRNSGNPAWGIVWGGAGFWCPVVAVPFALSQGLGKKG